MEAFDLRKWPQFKQASGNMAEPCIVDEIAHDSRRISSKNCLFVALSGTNSDGHSFIKQAYRAGARLALVRKEYDPRLAPNGMKLLHVDEPLRALQQIATSYRLEMRAKVIAITGSFGKTMLKDLLYQLLREQFSVYASPESFNSQLGVALSLLKIKKHHEVAIIEAGISKAHEMHHHRDMIRPDHVIITNIGKAHIASLGSIQAITEEKLKLLNDVPLNNWCLIPQFQSNNLLKETRAKFYFWEKEYAELPKLIRHESEKQGDIGFQIVFPNKQTIDGELPDDFSYVLNLIDMGVKASHLIGATHTHIAKALESYYPEPMRIELWKTQNGATLINDTYCQDPMSCDIALKQFNTLDDAQGTNKGKKIFIFSGLRNCDEKDERDLQRVAYAISKHQVDLCILQQQSALSQLIASINLLSPHTDIRVCKNQQEAFEAVKTHINPGDVVIVKGPKKIPINELIKGFDESNANNQVIINLAAIQSNIELIRSRLPKQSRIMVMVKALAYGTDDIRIAKFLKNAGVDILGVSYVDEGVSMRQAGVRQAIFVLNAADYEAQKAVKWDLEIGVSEPGLIHSIQKHAQEQQKKIKLHLHIDTGMSRFGCKPTKAVQLAKLIQSLPNVELEGVMTHFATSDNPKEDPFTLRQVQILDEAIAEIEKTGIQIPWKHACNSSATIRFGFDQYNMIRIGLAAYGLHTSPATRGLIDLRPAISLVSRLVGINDCTKGDTISYGRSYAVERERARIGVLPIGYFDGLHRNYSGKGFVKIRGRKAPMIGKICMDYMMVDISDIPAAQIGDPVLLFGEDESGQYLSPEELAEAGGSIVHELMTCLGPRIRRLFIFDESLRPR